MVAAVQVTLIFDLPPSPAPAGEVHAGSVAGIRQVHHKTAGDRAGWERTGLGADRSLASADRAIRTQCALLTRARSPTSYPGRRRRAASGGSGRRPAISKGAAPSGGSLRPCRGPRPGNTGPLAKPVTPADGHRNPESERSGEPRPPPSRPGDPPTATHPAGSMIADAVRLMSVHSRKQPDSHGRNGTTTARSTTARTSAYAQATGRFRW